jgi:hypothetical protein
LWVRLPARLPLFFYRNECNECNAVSRMTDAANTAVIQATRKSDMFAMAIKSLLVNRVTQPLVLSRTTSPRPGTITALFTEIT